MSNKEQVLREIIQYLDKADNLHYNDKLKYLQAMFDKHFVFDKLEHVLSYNDVFKIITDAKVNYTNLKTPMKISGRDVAGPELAHVAMIQSVITNLNAFDILKRLVKFDWKD